MEDRTIVVTFKLSGKQLPDPSNVSTYLTLMLAKDDDPKDAWHLSNPTVFIEPPKVVVGMEGGINQGASSEIPIEVVTIDYDGGEDDLIVVTQPDGPDTEGWVYSQMADQNPEWVSEVYDAYMEEDVE